MRRQTSCFWSWHDIAVLTLVLVKVLCVSGSYVQTCDNIGTFQQLVGVSLPSCAKECVRRQRCKVLMYRMGIGFCALKDNYSITTQEIHQPVCEYYTRDDWSHLDLDLCQGHTCDVTERCKSKTDGGFECQKTECPKSDDIADAKRLSSTHTIGTTNRYKCNNGFVGHGTPTITCGDDATWSVTDFRCVHTQSCPTPLVHYNNADLTHIEGGLYTPGTELTFTCREGYRRNGTEAKSTCTNTLTWDPIHIECYSDKINHERNGMQFAVIKGGLIKSYSDAVSYCKSIDGKLKNADDASIKENRFDKNLTMFALLKTKMPKINEEFNYTECVNLNGGQADETKTLKEKIEQVQSNWSGKACFWGRAWAPGEPDFTGNGDDCIVRDLRLDVLRNYRDYSCSFNASDSVGFICRMFLPPI